MGQGAILSPAGPVPLACQSHSLGRCQLPDLCSSPYAREAFHETDKGLNSCEFYLSSIKRWPTAANHQTQPEHACFGIIFGSLALTQNAFSSEQWGVWGELSSLPAAAADDISSDQQEHTVLAGKRLRLAAGVNNLPYASVGVPTPTTHYCNILHQEFLLKELKYATAFLGIYSLSSIMNWPKDRAF